MYSYHEKDILKTQETKKWNKIEFTLLKKVLKKALTMEYYNFVMLILRLLNHEEDIASTL